MDIFLIIAGAICLVLGLVGSVMPALPGPPLSYIGLLLLHFTDRVQFSAWQLIVWGILVLLTVVFDYLMPILGVKKWDGSKWGNWGCIVGTVVGAVFFAPWGILLGPFIGAVIGELSLGKREFNKAIKAGFGAFIGFLFGTLFKLGVCGWFIFCFIHALVTT